MRIFVVQYCTGYLQQNFIITTNIRFMSYSGIYSITGREKARIRGLFSAHARARALGPAGGYSTVVPI